MNRYRPEARVWVFAVALLSLGLVAYHPSSVPIARSDWPAGLILSGCAALAVFFPIRTASSGAIYPITTVFLVAAAILLPAPMLSVMVIVALTPATWVGRARPGAWFRWFFNVSQTVVAVMVSRDFVVWGQSLPLGEFGRVGIWLVASALFVLIQALVVGVVIALNSQVSLWQVDTLTAPALLGDGYQALIGVAVAGLWQSQPALLLLLPPMVVIAHQMTRSAHLSHLAQVDPKTGLHNHRHLEHVLEEEMARSQRLRRPLSVLFADMDLMRNVNNTYGHQAGDTVLKGVAAIFQRTVRKGDLVARFGGEEFVVLLPGTDAEEATFVAEQIRRAVASSPFALDEATTIGCTVSIGVATYPRDATDVSGLMHQADQAMYVAKRTRDAVVSASARTVPPDSPTCHAQARDPAGEPTGARRTALMAALTITVVGGVGSVLWALYHVYVQSAWLTLLAFLPAVLIAEFVVVRIAGLGSAGRVYLSFTAVVVMAAITMASHVAPLVAFAGSLFHAASERQAPLERIAYNLAGPALAAWITVAVHGALSAPTSGSWFGSVAEAVLISSVLYVANAGSVAVMASLHSRRPLSSFVRDLGWATPTTILLGTTGALMGDVYQLIGLTAVVVFSAPVLILRYTLLLYSRMSQQALTALEAAKSEVEMAHLEKADTLQALVETMSSVLDARDHLVSGHSKRVAALAVSIGRELAMPAAEQATLYTAGLLHDLGKVAVPERILHKPARLSQDEYDTMKEHAAIGEQIILEAKPLKDVARMVGEHHERYDGLGYPRGKQGHEISLGGRILAVADALDSMITDRPYSTARSLDDAMDELDRCAGSQFDRTVVAAFRKVVEADREGLMDLLEAATEGQPPENWSWVKGNLLPFSAEPGPASEGGSSKLVG